MIPLDITDEVVLRRTLEELEERLPELAEYLQQIDEIVVVSGTPTTIEQLTSKVNDIVVVLNAVTTALNSD